MTLIWTGLGVVIGSLALYVWPSSIWVYVATIAAGIVYCLVPLVREAFDLWKHRRHVRRVFREAAQWRKKRGDTVSQNWLRSHGYDRDGDKVA